MVFLYNQRKSPHFLYFYDKKNVPSVFQRRLKKMEKGTEGKVIVAKIVPTFSKTAAGKSSRKNFGSSIPVTNKPILKLLKGRKEVSDGSRKHWIPAILQFPCFFQATPSSSSIPPISAEASESWCFDVLSGRKIFSGSS